MEDIGLSDADLYDVDPLKWTEVRRRVAVVRKYLAITHPTAADRDIHAAMLGLRTGQFYNLVRAWRTLRRASALTTGIREVARPSRSRRGGVDPRAREIAREVIAQLGRDAPLSKLLLETTKRCASEQIRPPSRGTIWGLARELPVADRNAVPDGILIVRAFLLLPIMADGKVYFPAVALAVETPSSRILGIVMTTNADAEDALEPLVPSIRARLEEVDLLLTMTDGDADRFTAALPDATIKTESSASVARKLASTVGKRIGHLELRSRRPAIEASAVMKSARDSALMYEDAERAIAIACDHHNRSIIRSR